MRAIISTPQGQDQTERREVREPEPAAGEVLVRVRAFGVNRGELTLLRMRDGWQPGQDVAGEIIKAADRDSSFRPGDRVAGLAEWHGWAEQAVVPAHRVAHIPAGVDFVTAAALPMAGTTAANLVRQGGALLGARVLITGATGGVGHVAVQLARLGGADVAAVATPQRADLLRRYAGVKVIPEAAAAEGNFDLVLESVGGASLKAALEHVAPGGTVIIFGNSSREPAPLDFVGFRGHEEATIRTYFSARHEADGGRHLSMLLRLVAAGQLHVDVGIQQSWDRLNEVLAAFADRRFTGKAVLTVS
jgi:NADPH2:quinone reductase